ncbi:Na+/H+ antiporter subunit E [Cryobacterium sp. Hz7]|uniref:Na+/H+ antiporter subunit E n=1 Tax=Cryobacterium sandaracinum TaxID=1259247 RepID=A0ABY2JBK8_9MICO|nr:MULTISPECIES: Na+/H+ antiporter subunit E [Cryobacterium]TFB60131.1 Na+/H+ antiporter subunit E [Cryobacterium sp. Sr3]TFB66061.1 Na+/H+ antiporter subunit E [Cryobacterium sp. Hz7]TFC39685.1 Na+/H+ antiporter subunit E [Cryobacterium sp. TMT2-14]TFC67604.1 Na+/H+ antiporter subunit E [Cryobacterium sp. TMT2-4]TFD02210.1 Na+/H+ antiporter subunit E [Cryobacterium sandaracinum]
MSTPKQRLVAIANQAPLFLGLVLLWMLLWGSFSWLNLLTGTLLATLVSVGFYLPAVELGLRLNPWYTVLYLIRLGFDIVRGSLQVAVLALSPRYTPSNAIVAVHLRTRSDFILTLTGVSTSIVPGAIVVDVDRVQSTLYLHVLNVAHPEQVERFRNGVLAEERRIVMALGSREDVERLHRVSGEDRSEKDQRARDQHANEKLKRGGTA